MVFADASTRQTSSPPNPPLEGEGFQPAPTSGPESRALFPSPFKGEAGRGMVFADNPNTSNTIPTQPSP